MLELALFPTITLVGKSIIYVKTHTPYDDPWAIAFDEYGQTFLSDASGGANWWSLPLSAKQMYLPARTIEHVLVKIYDYQQQGK